MYLYKNVFTNDKEQYNYSQEGNIILNNRC
jgi:hypothetical protein